MTTTTDTRRSRHAPPSVESLARAISDGLAFIPGAFGSAARVIANGLIGDRLADDNHHIAIDLGLRHEHRPLTVSAESLESAHRELDTKISVFVHGLFLTEHAWAFEDDPTADYGTRLRADLGHTPFYVRYNTGRHISTNGRELADLLENLLAEYPAEIDEIALIGHSMGGLVLRSACHYGTEAGHRWVDRVRSAVYLGTPHAGSWVEQAANASATTAARAPAYIPLTRSIGRTVKDRSAGIHDLRFGYIVDDDWCSNEPHTLNGVKRTEIPLLAHADHYCVAASKTGGRGNPFGYALGDGLVGSSSAVGRRLDRSKVVHFPRENVRFHPGLSHLALAREQRIYEQLREWVAASSPARSV